MGDYARALRPGSDLSAAERTAIAEKLHELHGPAGRVHPARPTCASTAANSARRLQDEPRHDDGPARHALLRSRHRSVEPERRTTTRNRRRSSSAYVSAFNDYVRKELHSDRRRSVQAEHRHLQNVELQHAQPGQTPPIPSGMPAERDARPRERDEDQPDPQGAVERRLLRSGDAFLPGRLRDASPAHAGEAPKQHRVSASTIPGTWCTRRTPRSARCTTTWRNSSAAPARRRAPAPREAGACAHFLRRALTTLGSWPMRARTRASCGSPVMSIAIFMRAR